ncbi:urease accessory protein UreF [Deinococcus sp.]|uniref:urease accessory protein UreF n=1 Tax=Deinococcus sp. TaxID=47478 RepID=UPI003CC53ECF
MTLALLRLLQLSDSAFPAGTYAFSDGLETLTQRGQVTSAAELTAFLRGQLQCGWGRQDLPACALAWNASAAELAELDALLTDLKPVAGPRGASVRTGTNLRRAALHLWPGHLSALAPVIHHATSFGAIAAALGVSRPDAVTAYVSAWLLGRSVSATRLMKLGGLEAQRVAAHLEGEALACVARALGAGPDDLGGFSPALDIAASEQEKLPLRLFQT